MKEAMKLFAFILLVIGTVGLLLNEFLFDLGSPATVTFALFNLIGLILLAINFRSITGTDK